MEIPKGIQDVLNELDLNTAERIEYEGKVYWSLSLKYNGVYVPMGLPILYTEVNGQYMKIDQNRVNEILSNL